MSDRCWGTNGGRFLIAIDGSPSARTAVLTGLDLASATKATVRFLHASPLAERFYDQSAPDAPKREQILALDPVLAEAVACAGERGIEAEVEFIPGDGDATQLAAAIAGIASGMHAALIIVGSRGRGPVAGAVLGSVSQALLRYATVPVLVVHTDIENATSVAA